MARPLGLVRSLQSWAGAAWSWVGGALGVAGYAAVDPRRKVMNGMRPTQQTADQVLTGSLPALRAHCRHLERNNPTARAAVDGLVACVVGTGIALEPDTGDEATDAKIRKEWNAYIESCGVDGCGLYELQSLGFREVVTAGEALWRLVTLPERAKDGMVPVAVLPLEAEWIDDNGAMPARNPDGTVNVGGKTVDKYGRPVSYRIRNPEWIGSDPETLRADEVIHAYERRRALQSRGEPWFAPVIETLHQERDLVDAELASAKNTAAMALVITSEMHTAPDTTEDGDETDPAEGIRIGAVARVYPGEDVKAFSHTRPSQQIRPFREMLRGDNAGALRIAQRFLDRDVSRANYSSMRADNLDSERLLAPVREWYGHATAGRIYKAALPYLALKAGVRVPRSSYRLIPDGQPYVDPLKDVQGAVAAISAGLSTWEYEIGKRGGDYRQVWQQLAKEREMAKQLGLVLDLSGTNAPAPDSTAGATQEPAKTVKKDEDV